jgi:hypothetical protein
MNDEQIYWFARGYYEGRVHGNDEGLDAAYSDETRHAYRRGYDVGVSDYCDLDERSGEAA